MLLFTSQYSKVEVAMHVDGVAMHVHRLAMLAQSFHMLQKGNHVTLRMFLRGLMSGWGAPVGWGGGGRVMP